jgi:hypothetical protein
MSKIENINGLDFTPINNNYYGNPRYIVHFFTFLTDAERKTYGIDTRGYLFDLAVERSRKVGGKKYKGQIYGGGIVLSSYNLRDTSEKIHAIMDSIC